MVFIPCTSLYVLRSCDAGGSRTLPSAPILSYPWLPSSPIGNPLRQGWRNSGLLLREWETAPAAHSFPGAENRRLSAKRQPLSGLELPVLPVEVLPASGLLWQL